MAYTVRRFGTAVTLSFARPADLYLAVPALPQRIGEIMQRFPLPWQRASNCAYFIPGTGEGLGAIWEGGTEYQDEPGQWPVLVRDDDKLILREDGETDFSTVNFACAGGPMLVRDGVVTDIAQEIADGGFTGFSDGVKQPQVGVGLRADGLLAHVTAPSLTLTELAQVLRDVGCHTALKYDGGGSATLYRNEGGNRILEFGSDTRKFPAALVMQAEAMAPEDAAPAVAGHGYNLMGAPLASGAQMEDLCHSVNPDAPYYADLYLRIGAQLGIRGDVAYAQALHETNYFRFTGLVRPWQQNFGGLGATGPGNNGHVFATAAEGIMAQMQHLYAYATARPLPSKLILVDPRYDLVTRGSAPTTAALSGRWATDTRYGDQIDQIYEGILLMDARLADDGERAGWNSVNLTHAAQAHAGRVAAGEAPLASSQKRRTHCGIALLQQAVTVFAAPGGTGTGKGVLEAGSYWPTFRSTLDGGWYLITSLDGSNGWISAGALRFVGAPGAAPADPSEAIVVIDPGHGGSDTGAVGPSGLREKDVNLAVALGLRDRLEGAVGRVWLTRTDDASVSLAFRADLATASGGNLFLSVHNNSFQASSTGTETYYQCGYEQTTAVNEASGRLGCLLQSAQLKYLAGHNEACGGCCPPFDRGAHCRLSGVENPRDYYYVLRSSFIPAALTESLFLSNPVEEACMANPAVRDLLADALFQAIVGYLHGQGAECTIRGPRYGL